MNPSELFSAELIRLAFVLGMVLSVFLYEKSHLTTGSIVVPGFLGIHVFEPTIIFLCIFNAWVCYHLIHRLVPHFYFMENSSKFHALLITSVVLQFIWSLLAQLEFPLAYAGDTMTGFGYVIPGLIAHDMSRNGKWKTALNTLFVSYLLGAIVFAVLLITPSTALNHEQRNVVPFDFSLPLVLAFSTIGSVLLKLNTPLRSGGYITAAYIVFFANSFATLTIILLAALLSYVVCCQLLIPRMIIFGRRKFALVLIAGAISMWAATLLAGAARFPLPMLNHPSYAGVLILLPGLIANDFQRSSITNVGIGLGLLASWIFVLASLYYEIRSCSRPEQILPLVGCLCGILLVSSISPRFRNQNHHNQSIAISAT